MAGKEISTGTSRPVKVITPHGVQWSVRFTTVASAWARLTALKRRRDTEQSRKLLRDEGWKVIEK